MQEKIHPNADVKIRWKCDLDRPVIIENCEERNWKKSDSDLDDNYQFYWAAVGKIKNIFNPRNKYRLKNNQMINHFPNHYELTRKDLLAKNIKRFKPMQKNMTLVNG